MAPKGSRVSASASGVGDPNFEFVMSVFKNCEQVNLIKPDWNEVAKEHGIKHGHNASSKIKSIVEHHGLIWERNSIRPGSAIGDGAFNANAKAAVGEPKIAKGRGRKRKPDADAGDDGDDDEIADTPSCGKNGSVKKGKKSQPVVKAEDSGSEVEEVQLKKEENSDGVKKEKNENENENDG
ncbi:hypothetical protein G647_05379 [Cladophialophora carrionii CBS 160.54]|uniref:Myb-like DNA-binding domain-containing protein n=1 Tax=Cladophialophora carrionii CBS 160.54 TaxID=1279043 RepID=V9DC82_9EURO|nr:uncharacterized protein G647_05379 [Cladophialophora carrionii CBS 160.54]ETI23577.1 hypothetical protein G647_05379 [Cladophialophora carrionii CBS 160.54]